MQNVLRGKLIVMDAESGSVQLVHAGIPISDNDAVRKFSTCRVMLSVSIRPSDRRTVCSTL